MTKNKTNFAKTHIRIFDESGLIFAASPDTDAYDLTHDVIDLLRESHETGNDPMDESVSPAEFDTVGYLRALVKDTPGDELFDELVAILQEYPESTVCMMEEILDRLRATFEDDFIFAHIRVDADMPGIPLRDSVIIDMVQMKVATFALGYHVFLGDGVFR